VAGNTEKESSISDVEMLTMQISAKITQGRKDRQLFSLSLFSDVCFAPERAQVH